MLVDDLLIATNSVSNSILSNLLVNLKAKYKYKIITNPTLFTIKRDRESKTLSLSQENYFIDLLPKIGMQSCNSIASPMEHGKVDMKAAVLDTEEANFMRDKPYRSLACSLNPSTITRPDIAYACNTASRHLHIVELASDTLKSAHSRKTKKIAGSKDARRHAESHNALIASFKENVAICYTDGSALSNPGLCGAGASIFIAGCDRVFDAGVSLGSGTNNIGELAAIFICLTELMKLFDLKHFSSAVIFSDSKYALRCASSISKPTSNSALVLLLRSTLALARSSFQIDLCWTKGHAEIGGNNRVDQLSKFFASKAVPGLNPDYASLARNYFSCSRVWRYGFPLSSVPCFYFNIPASDLHLNDWSHSIISDDIIARSHSEPLDFKHSD